MMRTGFREKKSGAAIRALVAIAALFSALLVPARALAAEDGVVMRRFYNRYTGEHFYTASVEEADSREMRGWEYEGVGWYAPRSGAPVYRLYNPWVPGGDHHYTLSSVERASLVAHGWRDEGVGWYSVSGEEGVPLYRQYNPYAATGTHNYTTSSAERAHLLSVGWRDEGIGWRGAREGHGITDEEFAERARVQLGVPDLPSITYRIGTPYYWEGAGIMLRPIAFYQDGELVAFADCTLSGSLGRNIWGYTAP